MSDGERRQQGMDNLMEKPPLWVQFILDSGLAEIIVNDADHAMTYPVVPAVDQPTKLHRMRGLTALHTYPEEKRVAMIRAAHAFLEQEQAADEAFTRADFSLGGGTESSA